ncbi:MAG: hypothetical protein ACOCP8_03385 [archaeon]
MKESKIIKEIENIFNNISEIEKSFVKHKKEGVKNVNVILDNVEKTENSERKKIKNKEILQYKIELIVKGRNERTIKSKKFLEKCIIKILVKIKKDNKIEILNYDSLFVFDYFNIFPINNILPIDEKEYEL